MLLEVSAKIGETNEEKKLEFLLLWVLIVTKNLESLIYKTMWKGFNVKSHVM